MSREEEPGGLGGVPESVAEGFFKQEALRYRRALIAIERCDYRGPKPSEQEIATRALDAGDEAAG